MKFLVLGTFLALIATYEAFNCYQGTQNWQEEPAINNVSLVECLPHHKCCSMISTLTGTHYDCYEECPTSVYHKCGPDPKLGIQDIYYCYCKDHRDADCRPFLGI
ncbi:unnamed protein product, partial [Mesorhabditis spiculigera]